jgi:hypothetical protein
LPEIYRKRFIHFQNFDWNSYAIQNKWRVIASVFIGILSHLAWDAFTHDDGFIVELIPLLSANVECMQNTIPVYFLLQIFFSISGLIVVHYQLMQMPIPQRSITTTSLDHRYWLGFALLFLAIASAQYPLQLDSGINYLQISFTIKKHKIMSIISHSMDIIGQKETCFSIKTNQQLTASVTEKIRAEITNCLNSTYPIVYLNAKEADEIDLSGINEVIHSHYTLLQASKKLVFVYRKDSQVEKWVNSTGLDKFIDTAIIQ